MIFSLKNRLIAVDADGVLVNYHEAYRQAWLRAFDEMPSEVDPDAYWAIDRYDIRHLEGIELTHFRNQFDNNFWATIPLLDGVYEACYDLVNAGFELVCVSALSKAFESDRLKNLQDAGLPISRVIATENNDHSISPKATALHELKPAVFVDDFLPYMRGISPNIHRALIMREPNGSPNQGAELSIVDSQHGNLLEFSKWWLEQDISINRW